LRNHLSQPSEKLPKNPCHHPRIRPEEGYGNFRGKILALGSISNLVDSSKMELKVYYGSPKGVWVYMEGRKTNNGASD
jgi:hypothetical protein